MNQQHSDFSGGVPEHYDHGLGPYLFADFADELAQRVAATAPRRVLELAAGTGIVTRRLRDRLAPDCELVATDLNEPMLAIARTRFQPAEPVRFETADAQDLPFDDRSFDAITCQFGVMFFPDRPAAYREALRVLRPGGHYLFSVWSSFDHNPFARIVDQTVAGFFEHDPPTFYQTPFCYHDATAIQDALTAAGFTDVVIDTHRIQQVVDDPDRFARGLVFGNPVAEEIRTRGTVTPDVVQQAVAAALRAAFAAEPCSMPLCALFVTARRP